MGTAEVNAALETFGWEVLKAHLEAQGHRIEDVRWPDRERRTREGSTEAGVDVEFREDWHMVGLEIMQLHESSRHGRQEAEMRALEQRLMKELGPEVRAAKQYVVAVRWELQWMPKRLEIEAAVLQLKDSILQAARGLQPGQQETIAERPEFVRVLEVLCFDVGQANFGFFTSHAEQSFWTGDTADDIAEAIVSSRKRLQLATYPDARVLGLDRAYMPLTGLLSKALKERAARIPHNWRAVYFIEPGIPAVAQVWP